MTERAISPIASAPGSTAAGHVHACPACGAAADAGIPHVDATVVAPTAAVAATLAGTRQGRGGPVAPPPPLPNRPRLVRDDAAIATHPAPPGGAARIGPPGRTAATPPAGPLPMPAKAGGPRHPIHVGVAFGLVAGVYSVSLATVGSLQADANEQASALQVPATDVVSQMKAAHDDLDAQVTSAEIDLQHRRRELPGRDGRDRG